MNKFKITEYQAFAIFALLIFVFCYPTKAECMKDANEYKVINKVKI